MKTKTKKFKCWVILLKRDDMKREIIGTIVGKNEAVFKMPCPLVFYENVKEAKNFAKMFGIKDHRIVELQEV